MAAAQERLEAARRAFEARLETLDAAEILALAELCRELDDARAALRHYGRAAALDPNCGDAARGLADMLRRLGNPDQALVGYRRALEIDPGDAESHLNIANLLGEGRDYAAALAHYEAAAAARPDWYLPHVNKANTLAARGDLAAARAAYDEGLAHGAPEGFRFRRDLMLPVIATDAASYEAARRDYERALAALEADPPPLENPLVEAPGNRFFLAYHGIEDSGLQRRLGKLYLTACPGLAWTAFHCEGEDRPPGPRRIAVVSRFLHDHSIGRLVRGLLGRLAARADCEILLFRTAPPPIDPVAEAIDAGARETAVLPPDLARARETIAAAAPDLVFYPEIGMDPMTYFLAFARLAPVQCGSFGHPVTSGIAAIDHYLSCAAAEPPDADAWYGESLVRLAGTPFTNNRHTRPEPMKSRADFGLADEDALYFMAQNLFKAHPAMDAALADILAADTPESYARIAVRLGQDKDFRRAVDARLAAAGDLIFDDPVFLDDAEAFLMSA